MSLSITLSHHLPGFPSFQLGTVTLARVWLVGWLVGGKSCGVSVRAINRSTSERAARDAIRVDSVPS